MNILGNIGRPEDVRSLDAQELDTLCAELRRFIIENVSRTGGHLASNLGAVELTVALHRVFDTERDRVVFDVGHQSYAHKILTGRLESFHTLRTLDGISGFPRPEESKHDAFVSGHASTAVSVALGMARARTLKGEDYSVAAVIGDGALTGGMAYEALNDAGQSGEPLIVVLNDNEMSITKNVGGVASLLSHMRSRPSYFSFKKGYRRFMHLFPGGPHLYGAIHRVKTRLKESLIGCSIFEEMGFNYLGPIDGHDIQRITYLLQWARYLNEPVLVHIKTQKGRGYAYAEENPDLYHGVGPFDPEKGIEIREKRDFSSVMGQHLSGLADGDGRIVAITAAMQDGTGLDVFARRHPERFFDVAIAEGHAVTMAAGMAKQNLVPVVAVYSTFLQRAFDQLIHDMGILGLHVVLCVDRAGLVGEDGVTHQGVFDIGYLSQVPGMTILCPASFEELTGMLDFAVNEIAGPVAVRYPRGCEGVYKDAWDGSAARVLRVGRDITVVTYGITVNDVLKAAEMLEAEGISVEIIKINKPTGFDPELVRQSAGKTGRVLVAEEAADAGCVGEYIAAELAGVARVHKRNLGGGLITHGSVAELRELCGLDAGGLASAARRIVNGKEQT